MAPARQVAGIEQLVEIARDQRIFLRRNCDHRIPHREQGHDQRQEIRAAARRAGQITPTVPMGSFIAMAMLRNGGLCTAPSNLSAHAA